MNLPNFEFYVTSNSLKSIQTELLYDNIRNPYSFKYVYSGTDKTSFVVSGPSQNSGRVVYISQILLFNEYLPSTFRFDNL